MKCVFYVEDDELAWQRAARRLSGTYDLLRASNSEQACALWRARAHEIDLVMIDIELRDSYLSGVELTALLRGFALPSDKPVPSYARDLPALLKPVICLARQGVDYSQVHLLLVGADHTLAKPVNVVDLRRSLGELLAS